MADYAGSFRGAVLADYGCSDDNGYTRGTITGNAAWTITDQADQLTIVTNGTCGALTAKVEGGLVRIQNKVCPVQTSEGLTISNTILSGMLSLPCQTLPCQTLSVSYESSGTFTGTSTGSCYLPFVGTLLKQN